MFWWGFFLSVRSYVGMHSCMYVCMQWRRKVPKCGGGGGGGVTQTRNLCTFGKEQNINELYLDIWLFTNNHLC